MAAHRRIQLLNDEGRPERPDEVVAEVPQIGAEGEIYDPPLFRKGFTRSDGSGGFGPMASSDFASDLDIPAVIRNFSD